MAKKQITKPTEKQIVFTIEWTVPAENANVEEVIDKCRETGSAIVVDVRMKEEE